jgi:hypothetical protein
VNCVYIYIYIYIIRRVNWIGHILRRSCLLKHVVEGKLEERLEVFGRRGRRSTHLLDDLKRGYWKLKEEDLSRGAAAGRSPAEILGSIPTGGMDICLL